MLKYHVPETSEEFPSRKITTLCLTESTEYIMYNFIIEFYLPTIHTFILTRPNRIFDSTKIILKLPRPQPEHSLLVLWFGIATDSHFYDTVIEKLQTRELV